MNIKNCLSHHLQENLFPNKILNASSLHQSSKQNMVALKFAFFYPPPDQPKLSCCCFSKIQTESKLQFSPFISRPIPKQNTKYIFVTLVFRSENGNVFNFSFLSKLHFKTETYFFRKLKTLSDTDTLLDRFNAANFLGLRIV